MVSERHKESPEYRAFEQDYQHILRAYSNITNGEQRITILEPQISTSL
jgi:hypothetical protein